MIPFDPELYSEAEDAMQCSYSPYSKFKVGAALRDSDGRIFSGCNVENASYPASVCAETNTICSMIAGGGKKISALALCSSGEDLCPPCGICRQVINEFASHDTPVYLFVPGKTQKKYTLAELLPHSFGDENL